MFNTLLTLVRGAAAAADEEIVDRSALSISTRTIDLEERAVAALAAGREDLAAESAGAIAEMEDECAAVAESRASFANEIGRLRSTVLDSTRRLAALDRGRRIAKAAEAVRHLKAGHNPAGVIGTAALTEAEDTLRRLRERQTDDAAIENVMQSLDPEAASATLIGRLEAAGCGPHTKTTAADVLDRLRKRAKSITAGAN